MMDEETNSDDMIADTAVDMDAVESAAAHKKAEREAINAQIEAFLNSGGRINLIEPNVLSDPPQKPTSNYGSQPI
jgi:hypothetical protein